MTQPLFFAAPHASGSSFSTKRKLHTEGDSDDERSMQRVIKSPPLKRRATFPVQQPFGNDVPDLVDDSSPYSTSDNGMSMDQDQDQDMDMEMQDDGLGSSRYGESFVPRYDYEYGMSGSGGIGFGPGAEEDDDFSEEVMDQSDSKMQLGFHTFPSLTPHTNPHHFSNIPPYTSNASLSFNGTTASGMGNGTSFVRATSPLSAQPFSTSLRAPEGAPGLMQPSLAAPLSVDASAVERARSVHGPNCKSIPKLVISPHADPATGKQSMYSMCPDCGSCERAA